MANPWGHEIAEEECIGKDALCQCQSGEVDTAQELTCAPKIKALNQMVGSFNVMNVIR